MKVNRVLFVGMYPNAVDKYLNVFFQNLIFAMADNGIECIVVSPVSLTKYKSKINKIPLQTEDITPSGNVVKVYFPRYLSFSAKKIFKFNTRTMGEYCFQQCALKKAKKISKTLKFDIVYGHFILDGGLAAVRIGRFFNVPSFIAYGECDFKSQVSDCYRNIRKKDVLGLKAIISVSQKNTKEISKLPPFESTPIYTIPNGVDCKLFTKLSKSESRERFAIEPNLFVVSFVGGFIERKGDKRVLEAVNMLDNVYVAFAGKGDNPPSGEKVVFCAPVSHDQMPIFLNCSDVFVLPTLSEGSPNAVLEAMACGIPVISSDLPFNDDTLDDSNSIKIDPLSITEIANAIRKLRDDETLRKKLSDGAIKKSAEFDIRMRAKKIINYIEKL